MVFLIFGSSCQENEKITSFDGKEGHGDVFREKKRSYEVSRAKGSTLKGQKELTVGRAQWQNCVENLQISILILENAHEQCMTMRLASAWGVQTPMRRRTIVRRSTAVRLSNFHVI